jgi:hypothetical protein
MVAIWSRKRRFAWAISLLWMAASLTTLLALTAIEPARDCGIAF